MKNLKIDNETRKYNEIYYKKIAPQLDEFEKIRIQESKDLIKTFFVKYLPCIIFPIVLCCILFKTSNSFSILLGSSLVIFSLMVAALYFFEVIKRKSLFAMKMKKKILPHIIPIFKDIKYHNNSIKDNYCYYKDIFYNLADKKNEFNIIPNSEIEKSGLFEYNHNVRKSEDEYYGTYKDIPFEISETTLTYIAPKRPIEVFRGALIALKLNEQIKHNITVTSKKDFLEENKIDLLYSTPGLIASAWEFYCNKPIHAIIIILLTVFLIIFLLLKNKSSSNNKNKTKLVNSKYYENFNVVSSDKLKATYIITTSFLEKLLEIKKVFCANYTNCVFYEDKLLIAISSKKNLFEVGHLFKSYKKPWMIDDFYKELKSIYNLIDYIKNYEEIKTDKNI